MKQSGKNSTLFGFLLAFASVPFLLGQAAPPEDGSPAAQNPATSSSQTKNAGDSSIKPHDDSYVIGNGDVLAINVWKDADLSRTIPVRSDGKISLPLMGEIEATGKTPLALESAITDKLRSYITAPEVTVMVEQMNSKKFNILGQVNKPGAYPLTLSTTIMDAIAMAGGLQDFAKGKSIYVLRQKADGSQSRIDFNYKDFIKGKNPAQNIKLQPNDTVIVP